MFATPRLTSTLSKAGSRLTAAGGASGSPMFDETGEVIGITSAGNMERLCDPQTKQFRRIPNGVALSFARRIDVLLDWLG